MSISAANSVNPYSLSDTDSELDYSAADAYFAEAEQNKESKSAGRIKELMERVRKYSEI